MRICFLSRRYFPTVSGMAVYADNMVRQLVARGHGVTMLSQYYGGASAGVYGGGEPPAIPGAEVVGFESTHEQERGDFEADMAVMTAEVERRHAQRPFDLVHAQYGYPTGFAALRVARKLGLPAVVSIQGGDGHWVGECCATHRVAMRRVCTQSDAVIIGSDGFARTVADRLDVPRSGFTVVPGAVDTDRFHPRPGRAPGAASSPVRLLYHGRVDRRKGVIELLDAFDRLRADGRNVVLRVSGIGPDQEEVAARCAGTPGATATGAAAYAQAPAVYREADLFVSPTHAEGFSNTILEAMATGLPIVSCETTGVVDCLKDGRDSLLVPVSDVPALAAAIGRLLDDAPLRERLAAAALGRVRENFAWPVIAGAIERVYEAVLASPPRDAFDELEGEPEPCVYRAKPHLL
ncbi:glycosyltransferase family 4 protein [Phycisphaera mikurensis]|uniref:Putative glycosyltransferase n=1 Tax=Phycisphaera mikurensis (strain NBRC 102666 / KCTC 22515 / FYK2301M01) TaxID=1142394 RepID=I0IFM8_PHYMF|nr:glycosyltransferase family 4 protein [Phycisphaera mikurensis]MBB6440544.1 glycosyltransferase involved in cell wall biosynthesis [Phycisphaera mikurensis]BAM04066.1 putative glycosyltransferase [Phycisphaera mikurensis NBRC 102666]